MKQVAQRGWGTNRPSWRNQIRIDQTTALGSLAAAMLAYILYHLYPLIAKGLLW